MTEIKGNTYPVKDQIKSLGGVWNKDSKAWMVPDDKADEARKLVASAPKQKSGQCYYSVGEECQGCNKTNVFVGRDGLCGACRELWEMSDL